MGSGIHWTPLPAPGMGTEALRAAACRAGFLVSVLGQKSVPLPFSAYKGWRYSLAVGSFEPTPWPVGFNLQAL